MTGHRIRAIYRKELIDILRDRRTLIAMIVVPIVLYPLLMLGSIQAVSFQSEEMEEEEFLILLPTREQRQLVAFWLEEDKQVYQQLKALGELDEQEPELPDGQDTESESEPAEPEGPPPFNAKVASPDDPQDVYTQETLQQAVRARQVQLAVTVEVKNAGQPMTEQYSLRYAYDPQDIRSLSAYKRFDDIMIRRAKWVRLHRLSQIGVPPIVMRPFKGEVVTVTTAGSVLAQVLPLVLVLMTITGAIYPAIDLTAGERERGTLETLMVCPVPVLDLVVGKFMVVTTVAIMGAALNLASVSATVYFGGFESVVSGSNEEFPLAALPLILLFLVPFAVLMSAIMMAVCSFARTFKEAQNYVTPVILAVLIPGGFAALPATKLEGVMLVMPVGNMVLLTRDLLTGIAIHPGDVAWVLLSTTVYAAAAVAVAARVFGAESVVFSDSASIKSSLLRRFVRPTPVPSLATAVLTVSLLFPIWFYVQAQVQSGGATEGLDRTLKWMPLFFIGVPLLVCLYYKIDLAKTFRLRPPRLRYLVAALLLGGSAWVPARELAVLQQAVIAVPEGLELAEQVMQEAFQRWSPVTALLLLAVVPALSEEALFRGFLLSGLGRSIGKWPALIATACAFGAFHYFIFKIPITALLGLLLGYLCWQSASIWPAVLMHALHNGLAVGLSIWPNLARGMDLPDSASEHLPIPVLVIGLAVFATGLALVLWKRSDRAPAAG